MAKKSKASRKRRKNIAKKNRNKRIRKATESAAYESLEPRQLLAVTTLPFLSVGGFDQFSGGDPIAFGFGVDGVVGVESEPEFIGFEFDETITVGGIEENFFGSFGAQGSADVAGKIGVEYGYFISGGIGSIVSEGDFQYDIVAPTTDDFFTLTTDTLVSESRLQTVSPTISAYVDLVFELDASISGEACLVGCVGDIDDPIQIIDISGDDSRIELLALNRQSGVVNGNPVFDGEFRLLDLGLGGDEDEEPDMAAAAAAQQAREDLLAAQNNEEKARSELRNATTDGERDSANRALQSAMADTGDAERRNTAARDRLAGDGGDRNVDADGDSSSAGFGLNIGPAEGGLLGVTATVGPEFQAGALNISQEFGSLTVTLPEVNLSDTASGEGTLLATTEDGVFDKTKSDLARLELNVGTLLSSYFPGLGTTSFGVGPVAASVTTVEYTLGAGLDVTQDFQADFFRDVVTVTFDEDVTVQNTAGLLPLENGEDSDRTFRFERGTDIKFKPDNSGVGDVEVEFSLDREYTVANDIGLQLGLDGTLSALAASLAIEVGSVTVPVFDLGPVFSTTHELASFDIPAFSFDYTASSEADFSPVEINLSPDVTVAVGNQSAVIVDDSDSPNDGKFTFDAVITNRGLTTATGVGLNLSDLSLENNDLQLTEAVDNLGNNIALSSLTLSNNANDAALTGLPDLAPNESVTITFEGETTLGGGNEYSADLLAIATGDPTGNDGSATSIPVEETTVFVVTSPHDGANDTTPGVVDTLREAIFEAENSGLLAPALIQIDVQSVNLLSPILIGVGGANRFRIVGRESGTVISSPAGVDTGALLQFSTGDVNDAPYLLKRLTFSGESGGNAFASSSTASLIDVDESDLVLESVTIQGHTTTGFSGSGAAINAFESNVTIGNSSFSFNSTNQIAASGGAINLNGGELVINNSGFFSNTASGGGGAISVSNGSTSTPDATVTIADSVLSGNTAAKGAALFFFNRDNVHLDNVEVTGNTATDAAGGIIEAISQQEDFVTASQLVIYNNTGDNFVNVGLTEGWASVAASLGADYVEENITQAGNRDIGAYDESTGGGITYEFTYTAPNANQVSVALLGKNVTDGSLDRAALKLEQFNNSGKYGVTEFSVADFLSTVDQIANARTHVVFVADGTDMLLYLNGTLVDTLDGASLNISGLTGLGQVRTTGSPSDVMTSGSVIHGFAAYDRALTPEEIALSAAAGLENSDNSQLNVSDDNSIELGLFSGNGFQSQNVESIVNLERSSRLIDIAGTSSQSVVLANTPEAEVSRVFWTLPGRDIASSTTLNPSFTIDDDGVLKLATGVSLTPGTIVEVSIQGTDTEGNIFVDAVSVTAIAAPTVSNVTAGVSVVHPDDPQPDFVIDDGGDDLFTVSNFATVNWNLVADTEYIVRAFTVGGADVDDRLLVIPANSQTGFQGEANFTNLFASTQYQFSVEARNLVGETDPVESSVSTTHRPPPTAVEIISAVEDSDTSEIVVQWKPSQDADGILNQLADGYRVFVNGELQSEPFFYDDRGEVCSTVNDPLCTVSARIDANPALESDPDFLYSFTVENTDPETEYTIEIHAVNAAGTRIGRVVVETDLLVPERPTNVSARGISPTRALIEWDTSANATEYKIVGQTPGGEVTQFLANSTISAGTERVVVDGLEPGENYTFWVIAGNEDHGVASSPRSAQTINETPGLFVTTTDDVVDPNDFQTSLREAINFANDQNAGFNNDGDADNDGQENDTIRFDVFGAFAEDPVNGQTILLNQELQVSDSLTIVGETGIQLSGQDSNRVFFVDAESAADRINLTLQDLVLRNGLSAFNAAVPNSGAFVGLGGAIYFDSNGELHLEDSTVRDSNAEATFASTEVSGGAIHSTGPVRLTRTAITGNAATGNNAQGGGVYSESLITVENSFVDNNTASASGSENETGFEGAKGGGLSAIGAVRLNDSTVSNNAVLDNAIGGGGVYTKGSVALRDSTFDLNRALGSDSAGGGILANGSVLSNNSTFESNATYGVSSHGGGIATENATLTNTTFASNSVFGVAGQNLSFGGGVSGDNLQLDSTTFTGNTVIGGSGAAFHATTNASLANSIVLANGGATEIEVVNGTLEQTNNNILGNVNVDDVFQDTLNGVGILGINGASGIPGGPVETIVRTVSLKLDTTNPALDLNSPSIVQVDARGNARAVDFPNVNNGGTVDAGAFETGTVLIVDSLEDSDDLLGFTTLREAITFANELDDFDVIEFADRLSGQTIDLQLGQLPVITGELVLDGGGLAERLTIDAGAQSRHITFAGVGDLELNALILTNGRESESSPGIFPGVSALSGGSIRFQSDTGSVLRLNGTTISNSATFAVRARGGAISAENNAVFLTNSELINNSTNDTSALGGAISAQEVNFVGSNLVENNKTTGDLSPGGAIYAESLNAGQGGISFISYQGTRFASNYTSGDNSPGGAIFAGDVNIGQAAFEQNETRNTNSPGGALAIGDSDTARVIETTFDFNRTLQDNSPGGALYVGEESQPKEFNFLASSFTNNSTSGSNSSGGAIFSGRRLFATLSLSVIGNSTSGLNSPGGGIAGSYSQSNGGPNIAAVYIDQGTISGNSTAQTGSPGGGISAGSVLLSNSTITGNSTNSQSPNLSPGGGIYSANRTTSRNSLVLGNYSHNSDSNDLQVRQVSSDGELRVFGQNIIGSGTNDIGTSSVTGDGSTQFGNPGDVFASTTPVNFDSNFDGTADSPSLANIVGGLPSDNGGRRQTIALNPDLTVNAALDSGDNLILPVDTFDVDGDGDTEELIPLDANFGTRITGLGVAPLSNQFLALLAPPTVDLGATELQGLTQEAPSLVVTTLDDSENEFDGLTSLREAIAFADSGDADGIDGNLDRITFDPSLAGETIQLDGTALEITQSLIIDASDIGGITIDALQRSRVLHFDGLSGNLSLNGLTLTSGRTEVPAGVDGTLAAGGGVRFDSSGTLTLQSSRLTDSQTQGDGAGGGGIFAVGNVVLNNSVLDNNRTRRGSSPGGAVQTLGSAIINSSTLSNNYTASSDSSGGAVSARRLDVTNATIVKNSVSGDQSIGGGLHAELASTISNSIVLDNVSDFDPASSEINRNAVLAIAGRNIVGESSFTFDTDGTSAINADFEDVFADASLADNGGSLLSFALLPSTINPALDGGQLVSGLQDIDGRGLPRSVDLPGISSDSPIDLGAYELQSGTQELPGLLVTTDSDVVNAFDFATSLREAIAFANDTNAGAFNNGDADGDGFVHDTISFQESLRGETITLGGSQLSVTASTTIAGLGADQLTISGNDNSRIFSFFSNDDAIFTVSDLSLTNGVVPRGAQPNPAVGGAIFFTSGNDKLVIERSVISDSAANGGGAIFFGGNNSELEIVDSALINNEANFSGSALLTFGNTTTSIVNSTVSGNVSLSNSGAIFQQTAGTAVAAMEIRNTTVAANTGFGVQHAVSTPASTIEFGNSIFADNSGTNLVGGGTFTSLGHNLTDDSSSFLTGSNDQPNVDPLLSPLAFNGGTTPTHALQPSSPAIDKGSNDLAVDAANNPLTSDQTGVSRISDETVDVGAFESEFVDPFLLGDADLSGAVDFADIPAFINLLLNGTFLDEADIDRDGDVDFQDIPPFIQVLLNVGSANLTLQSVVVAPPVSSAASLVSVSQPESIASVDATVEAPLTTETSDAIVAPAEFVEYDSLEPVEAIESTSVEASQFSAAASLPTAPVLASADEYRLPERQAITSSTPLSLVGGVDGSESRVEKRQFSADDTKSDQHKTGVENLLDETFATYEDDLEVVFS